MFKSIVIEGGDGVGKSTLAKHLASNITENLDGYEAFYARFPSNGVSGFREFFLNQKGSKPSIKNQQLVWSESYQSGVPPITNLMHIMADFYYVYSVIPASLMYMQSVSGATRQCLSSTVSSSLRSSIRSCIPSPTEGATLTLGLLSSSTCLTCWDIS